MDTFGVFGIIPLSGPVHNFPQSGSSGRRPLTRKNDAPVTPAVFKEKIITSGLMIASLPVIYMIVNL